MSKTRRLDQEFLRRMDTVWGMVATIVGSLGISSIAYQLYNGNHNPRLLAIFGVWIACVVLPLIMEISALISNKVRRRFLSWFMLVTGAVVMMIDSMADAFAISGAAPSATGLLSGLIIWFILRPFAGRLSRYFQRNLRNKTYQTEVEAFDATGGLKRDVFAIIIFYIFLGLIVSVFFIA